MQTGRGQYCSSGLFHSWRLTASGTLTGVGASLGDHRCHIPSAGQRFYQRRQREGPANELADIVDEYIYGFEHIRCGERKACSEGSQPRWTTPPILPHPHALPSASSAVSRRQGRQEDSNRNVFAFFEESDQTILHFARLRFQVLCLQGTTTPQNADP